MTPEQIEAARHIDGPVFTLAGVFNTSLYWRPDSRAELERGLSGGLAHKYQATCKALAQQHPRFNAEPVSTELAEEQREPDAAAPIARDADVKALAAQVARLHIELGRFSRWAFWGFIVVAVIAYVR